MYHPHFSFIPKTGIAFPEMDILYLLCRDVNIFKLENSLPP